MIWVLGYLLCGGVFMVFTVQRHARSGLSQKDMDKFMEENAPRMGADSALTKEWGQNRAVQLGMVFLGILLWPIGIVAAFR